MKTFKKSSFFLFYWTPPLLFKIRQIFSSLKLIYQIRENVQNHFINEEVLHVFEVNCLNSHRINQN